MAPEDALQQPRYSLAYLMTFGTVEHWQIARAYFDDADFRQTLLSGPVGVFTAEAWLRWHEYIDHHRDQGGYSPMER